MTAKEQLSRRERDIMNVIYAVGQATVRQVCLKLPDPLTSMAVRRMLHILEAKGHLRRHLEGREVVYSPVQAPERAGLKALRSVLDTYFSGSLESALSAHLIAEGSELSSDAKKRLRKLIQQAREDGPRS